MFCTELRAIHRAVLHGQVRRSADIGPASRKAGGILSYTSISRVRLDAVLANWTLEAEEDGPATLSFQRSSWAFNPARAECHSADPDWLQS